MPQSSPTIQVIGAPIDQIVDVAAEACVGGAAEETLVIAASAGLARFVRERIAEARGAAVTPNLHTLRSLAEAMAGPSQPISPAERRLRIADAVLRHTPGGRLGESCATPGFKRYVEDLIRRLQQARLDPKTAGRLARRGPKAFQVAAAAYADYDANLYRLGLTDEYDLIARAAADLHLAGLMSYAHVLAVGFTGFASAQVELLLAAARQATGGETRVFVPTPAGDRVEAQFRASLGDRSAVSRACEPVLPTTAEVRYVVVDQIHAEVEGVAREIVRVVRAGGAFDDCAVVCRTMEDYSDLIGDLFTRFGIPYTLRNDLPLQDHPISQLALALCEMSAEGWKRPVMLELPACGFTMVSTVEAARLRRLSTKRAVRHGRERWMSLRGASDDARLFLEALARIDDALGACASWREFAAAVNDGLRIVGVRDAIARASLGPGRASGPSASAYAAIEDAIDLTARMGEESGASCTPAAFADRLARTCAASFYPVSGSHSDGVSVMEPAQVTRPFRNVYVVGLTEGRFPKPARDNPILDSAAAARLGLGDALPSSAQRAEEEKLLFELACGTAVEHLWLSHPQFDDDGTPLIPSSHLAALDCPAPGPPATVELASVVGLADLAEHLGARWGEQLRHRTEIIDPVAAWCDKVAALDAGLAHIADLAISREPARATLRHADTTGLAGARSLSVSAGDMFAVMVCPFQAFAHRVLRVKEETDDLTRADDGSILHDALHEFMRDRKAQRQLEEGESGRTEAGRLLEQAITTAWRKHIAGKPDLNLEDAELGAEAWRRAAPAWVDRELAYRTRNPGFRPQLLEVDFGVRGERKPLSIRVDGLEFIVSGRIDRVDVDSDTGDAIIIDYKTGLLPRKSDVESGDDPQMHAYWRATEQILKLRPMRAMFDGMKENRRQEHQLADPQRAAHFDERADRAATRIANGDIEVRPQKGACARCDLIALCRFNPFLMPYDESEGAEGEEDVDGAS